MSSSCRILFSAAGQTMLQTLDDDVCVSYTYDDPEVAALDFLHWWDGNKLETHPNYVQEVATSRARNVDVDWDEPKEDLLRKLKAVATWTDNSFLFCNLIHQLRSSNVLREDNILAVH